MREKQNSHLLISMEKDMGGFNIVLDADEVESGMHEIVHVVTNYGGVPEPVQGPTKSQNKEEMSAAEVSETVRSSGLNRIADRRGAHKRSYVKRILDGVNLMTTATQVFDSRSYWCPDSNHYQVLEMKRGRLDSPDFKVLHDQIQSCFNKLLSNAKINVFYNAIEAKNFQTLIDGFARVNASKDLDELRDLCDNLENAFNIIRLEMDDSLQKIKIEDYQRDLFELRKIAAQSSFDKDSAELNNNLKLKIDTIVHKFESRKSLKKLLDEFGTDEDELEKDMQETRTAFS